MPAKLVLSLNSSVLGEFSLEKERLTIGRRPDNDIQVDNLAVSGQHAAVITILNDSFLEDLDSTNGTYVNGKLIKKHALRDGDVVISVLGASPGNFGIFFYAPGWSNGAPWVAGAAVNSARIPQVRAVPAVSRTATRGSRIPPGA